MFSVEKAICPSVSSPRLEPTGRKAGGYLKVGRMDNEEEEGMTKGRRVAQRKDREEQREIESKGGKKILFQVKSSGMQNTFVFPEADRGLVSQSAA